MVSIVIPNYNGKSYLGRCLASLEQEEIWIQEVIVVDNASTDSDYNYLKKQFPTVIWKQLNKNYGFSKAVNEGIKMAKSDYVFLLNNDTEVQPGCIAYLLKLLRSNKKTFAVCSQMIRYDNNNLIDDAGDEYNLLGWAYKRGDGKPVGTYPYTEEVFSACAGAALYRKKIFNEIGYFDEHFFAYLEDVDISYRAKIYGYKNMYCPKAQVLHIGSATSGSKYNEFKVKLAARNNIWLAYKNMPLVQYWLNSPFLLMGIMIKYLLFWKKGFRKAYQEGVREAFAHINELEKTPFNKGFIKHYIQIELSMLLNTIRYMTHKV